MIQEKIAGRRILGGCLYLLLFVVIVAAARIYVEQPSPEQKTYTFGDATLFFETDRTTVWQVGDCVTLHWQIEHIRDIHWSQGATVGVNTTQWCATRQVAIAYFTIHLQDGSVRYLAPLGIFVVRNQVLFTLLPLLFLAGWCFGLHRLAARAFEWLPTGLRAPFSVSGRVSPLLVVIFLSMNAVVLWNAIDHDPKVAYDASGHNDYVRVLAQGRLPTQQDTGEYFSPPLPYLFPALVSHLSGLTTDFIYKLGQLQNVPVSLIAAFMLLRLGARLEADSVTPRAASLFLLATLPVYYKSFAFLRGEPFVVMFTLLLCDCLFTAIQRSPRLLDALVIGFYGGMILLSRQWGVLVLLGIVLWWIILLLKRRRTGLNLLLPGFMAGVIAILLAGWFYLAMIVQTGSVLAFNRPIDTASKPTTFFTGLGGEAFFTYAYTPGYDSQVLPIFYTEIWGDYFGFFYLQRPPIPSGMPPSALAYMGSVNAVSFLPTLVLFGGFIYGLYKTIRLLFGRPDTVAYSLFIACIIVSLAGFIWFLARYPTPDADTAKATYMLHIFPLACLLAGKSLHLLEQRWPRAFQLLIVALVVVAIHNLPMYFSRIS